MVVGLSLLLTINAVTDSEKGSPHGDIAFTRSRMRRPSESHDRHIVFHFTNKGHRSRI
jgi:hypothetical protein